MNAAAQLFVTGQYEACATRCAEDLSCEPDNLDLRLLRARALMALRRDGEAKRELSRVLRWHPDSHEGYRLLGELAIRSGKLHAAGTFLTHAVRLAPADGCAVGLLDLVQCSIQPTVAVEKLPAATATVGCSVSAGSDETAPVQPRRRFAAGSHFELMRNDEATERTARFGRYLVDIGALTPRQLRAALDYHRRAGVRLGAAAVALGFLSAPAVESAARDYHGAPS